MGQDIFKRYPEERAEEVGRFGKILVDSRNFLDDERWEVAGFKVEVLGDLDI